MATRIRYGGAWRNVTSGGIRVRYGGQWVGANKCRIKIGNVGGGYWFDSGYVGYPNPPQNFGIPYWDFANVGTTWSAPAAGGAPVSYYQVVKTDQHGNWYGGYPINVSGTTHAFSVTQDERSQLYVRSVSTAGLASGWVGPLRVQIGHTQLSHVENQPRTRSWNSPLHSFNLYVGGSQYLIAIFVPASVLVSSWYINARNTTAPGGWAKLSPGTNTVRNMYHIFANAMQPGVLNWANPTAGWFGYSHWGQDSGWGFMIDGGGYGTYPSSPYNVYGEFQIWGTEHYTEAVTVIDRTRVENTTW